MRNYVLVHKGLIQIATCFDRPNDVKTREVKVLCPGNSSVQLLNMFCVTYRGDNTRHRSGKLFKMSVLNGSGINI